MIAVMKMKKIYVLDLDGTMYRGTQRMDGGLEFLTYLQHTKQPYYFLTNNSKRTRAQNVEHMEQMGYTNIQPDSFFTSAMAAAIYARKHYTQRKAWMIGEAGLQEALLENGFELVEKEQPDFVFVGLDQNADYQKYAKAVNYLAQGAILIGTNNDRLLAQPNGFAVGNGSIVAMMEYASSQTSPKIGKPYSPILEEALSYIKKSKDEVILVGDNLETDIQLGLNHGVETILVLGGVHSEADCERLNIYPSRIIQNLKELIVEN